MATIIDMPKLSDTMTVGTLVNWLKQEGDPVSAGDMLAEVETDKATMELENFEEGVLLKQYVKVGEQVPIGAPIAAVGKKGEVAPEAPVSGAKKAPQAEVKKEEPVREEVKFKETEVAVSASVSPKVSGGRIKASPLARKIAASRGLSLEGVRGTGPDGRIVKVDVLSAIERGPSAGYGKSSKAGALIANDEAIPVSNMRRAIAAHLVQSKTQIPHFYLDIEVDAGPLMDLRAVLNKNSDGAKLTVNDFILKATADALRRVPKVNCSWQGEVIQQHGSVNLAFGVAVEEGLVTPVIRDAQTKTKTLTLYSIACFSFILKIPTEQKLAPQSLKINDFITLTSSTQKHIKRTSI